MRVTGTIANFRRSSGEPDLGRLAVALRAIARNRTSSLQYHLAVAKHVVDELYGGKLEAIRSEERDGADGPSFNEIARALRGTIQKTTLHRALWAYEVRETTPVYVLHEGVDAGVPTLERVSPDRSREQHAPQLHVEGTHFVQVGPLLDGGMSEQPRAAG